MGARLLSLALLLACGRAARAAAADPSLMPEFERHRRPAKAAPRRQEPPPPAEDADAPPAEAALPEPTGDRERLTRRLAEMDARTAARRPYVVLRTWVWRASGSLDTRYNVKVPRNQVTPPDLEVFLGETQKYGGSGTMLVESAEVAPFPWLSFQGEYGTTRQSGSYTDHYWVHAPDADTLINFSNGATWHKPDHEDDVVYAADARSYRDWAAATVYFRVFSSAGDFIAGEGQRHAFDVGLGAERYRQNARVTNLALTQNNDKYYAPGLAPGPVAGYDSTYEAYWRGPHLALRDEVATRGGFSLQGVMLYSPVIEFSGRGFDNLSAAGGQLRKAAPNFADWAHGSAIHFFVAAGWSPWRPLRLEAGYQRLYFFSRTGLRRYYNPDGSASDVQLDNATAEFGGFFAGGSLRF
ncbi:MAG: hypothetical protein HY079_11480 [Elusimicrobia bacterium]|nr:hypothetical protein [Elusimicrobiota bacterium]